MAKTPTEQPIENSQPTIDEVVSNITSPEDWIELYRVDEAGRNDPYRGRYRVDDFDLERVKLDHGGGNYYIVAKDGQTKRFKSRRSYFSIDGPPLPIRTHQATPNRQQWGTPAAPENDATTSLLAELKALREEVNTLRQGANPSIQGGSMVQQPYSVRDVIRQEIREALPPQPQTPRFDWSGLIGAMPAITGLMQVLRPPTSSDEALRLVTTILKMRGEPVTKESSFGWKEIAELAKSPAASKVVEAIASGLTNRQAVQDTQAARRVVPNRTIAAQPQKGIAWKSPISSTPPQADSSMHLSAPRFVTTDADASQQEKRPTPKSTKESRNGGGTDDSKTVSSVSRNESAPSQTDAAIGMMARMLLAGAESDDKPDPQEAAETILSLIDTEQIGEYLSGIKPGHMVAVLCEHESGLIQHQSWLAMIEGVIRERTIEIIPEDRASDITLSQPSTPAASDLQSVAETPEAPQPEVQTPPPAGASSRRTRKGAK